MLYEEPVGILSISGILYKSDVNTMAGILAEKPDFRGKTTEAAKNEYDLDRLKFEYDERERRIVSLPPPGNDTTEGNFPPRLARLRPRGGRWGQLWRSLGRL